jgi:FolB domain-containing protein
MNDDRIEIKDLLLRTIVGIKPDEREKKQDVLLNLTLMTDVRPVGLSDDIDQAVNYRTVTKAVIDLVERAGFHTVEKLATEVARLILTRFDIAAATIRIEKPGALRFARSVGVSITRRREDFQP